MSKKLKSSLWNMFKHSPTLRPILEKVLLMEKEKEVIRKACCKELDKLKAENIELKHRLEVIRHAH